MEGYRLMVLEGSHETCRAFLAGVTACQGLPWRVHFADEQGVHTEPFTRKLLERLHLEKEMDYVVLAESLVGHVRRALAVLPAEAGLDLTLRADHPIRRASFAYRFHVYSRDVAATVRGLPAGVSLEGAQEQERVEPDAGGVEAYAPEHEYELTGEGKIQGGFVEVLLMREKLAAVEMVKTEPVELVLGEVAEDSEEG